MNEAEGEQKGWGDKKWTWWEAADRPGSLPSSLGSSGPRCGLQEAAVSVLCAHRRQGHLGGISGPRPPDPWRGP